MNVITTGLMSLNNDTEYAPTIRERVEVAFELTNVCSEWRRAEAEEFKESITTWTLSNFGLDCRSVL